MDWISRGHGHLAFLIYHHSYDCDVVKFCGNKSAYGPRCHLRNTLKNPYLQVYQSYGSGKGRLTNRFCNQKRPMDVWGVLSWTFLLSQINIDF